MKLASIQPILSVEKHPNADLLDVVQVLGYKAIVKRDQWKVGDLCIFIEPDSVLPEVPWSAFYRAKSGRVKAIRLRNVWSFGIVESAAVTGYTGPMEPNLDVTEALGITKFEPPAPQDLNASGPYGFGIPKTDEDRYQSIADEIPWGAVVDVTLKVDGQSFTALRKKNEDGSVVLEVGGRTFLYKLDCDNNYTRNAKNHQILEKLAAFCEENNVNLAIRGESYGQGIQKFGHNPHSKKPLGLALFSTWLIDERQYARKGHPFYIFDLAPKLGLPTVPVLEKDVVLTPELIKKYAEELVTINGEMFEGVVIQHKEGSFKIISLHYDSKK